jgi:ribose-phosphate pyrophosphokinase
MLFFALKGSEVLGRRVAVAGGWPIAPHEERDFDHGEHKARPLVDPRGRDVFVLAALQGGHGASVNDRLMRFLFFLAACHDHGAARVTAIAPYLPYGRKDRRTKAFDPLGARYVAQAIEAMGCHQIVTLEAHNIAAFENGFRRPTLHLATDRLFAADIAARAGALPLAVLSPDPGGIKRAQLMHEALEAATGGAVRFGFADKRRSAGVVSGTEFAGDVAGAAVHILDDMICGGGTMVRAATAARARGAAEVHGLATHALFTQGAAERLIGDGGFDSLTVTDSTAPFSPEARALAQQLRVLGAGQVIADAIARIHDGRPEHDPAAPCIVPLETHQ